MLWLIESCQNKVSADQYHMTILQAQVMSSEVACFLVDTSCMGTYIVPRHISYMSSLLEVLDLLEVFLLT